MYRHRVDVGCIVDVLFLYIHLGKIADIDFLSYSFNSYHLTTTLAVILLSRQPLIQRRVSS